MQSAKSTQDRYVGIRAANSDEQHRITDTNHWMPRSGNGPYLTIPLVPSVDPRLLGKCGVPSFIGARDEVRRAANDYAAWAVALVDKARRDRLDLSRGIRDEDGGLLVRPHRVRLCLRLDMTNGYLCLYWRGVVKQRGRWTRIRASTWNCEDHLDLLITNVHPAEELLIRRLEAEAAYLRIRWFALVRGLYYMNVIEEHRLTDLEAGKIRNGKARGYTSCLMQRLQSAITGRYSKS